MLRPISERGARDPRQKPIPLSQETIMKSKLASHSAVALALVMLSGPFAQDALATPAPEPPFERRPITFEMNKGQADAGAQFVARGPGAVVLLKPTEAVITVSSRPNTAARSPKPASRPEPARSNA